MMTDIDSIKARRDWHVGRDLSATELRLNDEHLGRHYAEDVTFLLDEIERLRQVVPMTSRATPDDAGCWIDGHWGQYGVARMVSIAEDYGYDDAELIDIATRHLATIGPSDAELISDDEHEILSGAADEVEAWLTEHVAPTGHYFEWWDGEFFLRAEETGTLVDTPNN